MQIWESVNCAAKFVRPRSVFVGLLTGFVAAGGEEGGAVGGLEPWPEFAPGDLAWEKVGRCDTEDTSEIEKFAVRDAANLQFELGDRVAGDAPAEELKFASEDSLGPAAFVAQFADSWPD